MAKNTREERKDGAIMRATETFETFRSLRAAGKPPNFILCDVPTQYQYLPKKGRFLSLGQKKK